MNKTFGKEKILIVILLLVVLLFISIFRKRYTIYPSFYYWKTTFSINKDQNDLLRQLHVKKLYIRFFDIDLPSGSGTPDILGEISFPDTTNSGYEVVPVVFITNRTMLNIPGEQIEHLSQIIHGRIAAIAQHQKFNYSEIQLDCDWSDNSRDNFFKLVSFIKESAHKENKIISATIRLHQIKYYSKTGIPPVDKGMLMFYNMGEISPDTSAFSIYNSTDADKYVKYISKYPLKIDAALPIFSNLIQIRYGKAIGLLSVAISDEIKTDSHFRKIRNNYFAADSSFYFRGSYFIKDDLIKIEECNPQLTLKGAKQLDLHLHSAERTIALFDLNENNLRRYRYEDFKKIFDSF